MSNPKQCMHKRMRQTKRAYPTSIVCLNCDDCDIEFDPQELVSALVFVAERIGDETCSEGTVAAYQKCARKALKWEDVE